MFDKIIASKFRTVLFFISLGLICYGWMIYSPFKLLDDYACIIQNSTIHSLSNWKILFADSFFRGDGAYYRPLVSLSFMLEYRLFALQQVFYNLDNIFLHIACAILVWASLRRLLKDHVWAFFTAMVFLIHPAHWEQITNIPGRSILLCAFFVLAAFYLLLKSLDQNARRSSAVICYVLSLAAFAAGLLSKESAATFPLAAAGLMFFTVKADARRKIFLTAPYFLILAGYLWLRSQLGITQLTRDLSLPDVILAVATFLKSAGIHLQTLIMPSDLVYDRSLEVFRDFHQAGLWITVGVWVLIAAALAAFRRKIDSVSRFWLLWIVLGFLPVSQLVPIYVSDGRISIADHFLYLPSVGIFVFLVQAARIFFRRPDVLARFSARAQNILLAAWLVLLISLSITQALISTNQFAMFERTLEDNPQNHRVRTALGSAYGYAGMPGRALEHFSLILERSPMDAKARIGLGKALCDLDRCLDGLMEYHRVLYPSPLDAEILRDNLDKTYAIVIRDYQARLNKDPDNAEFHHVLATVYIKTGRVEEGLAHLRRALELKPDFAGALFLMAGALEKTGDAAGAAEYDRRFIDAVSADEHFGRWMAFSRLAGFYRSRNQPDEAQKFDHQAREEEKFFQGSPR